MKKSILVLTAIIITFGAYAFVKLDGNKDQKCKKKTPIFNEKKKSPGLFYLGKVKQQFNFDLSTRFTPVKQTRIAEVTNFREFFRQDENNRIVSVETTTITVIKNDMPTSVQITGTGEQLSQEQIKFLASCDNSTNLKISARCQTKDPYYRELQSRNFTPHITLVPEKQARYSLGKEAFLDYIKKENKKNDYGLDSDKIGFAKLSFTVDKTGKLTNMKVDRKTGLEYLDDMIINLVNDAPGEWLPAENTKGEKVEQVLVVSFGRGGC